MKKCSKCGSLLGDQDLFCPVKAERCPIFIAPSEFSPSTTIALTAEQVKALLPVKSTHPAAAKTDQGESSPQPGRSPSQPLSPSNQRSDQGNQAARLARTLGFLALLPLFPIGIVAVIVSLIALVRAENYPNRPERGKAWFGLVLGALFGGTWLILSVWLVRDLLLR